MKVDDDSFSSSPSPGVSSPEASKDKTHVHDGNWYTGTPGSAGPYFDIVMTAPSPAPVANWDLK
jgi:hypothetical protein